MSGWARFGLIWRYLRARRRRGILRPSRLLTTIASRAILMPMS
jgi:hypothetical protein